MSDKTLARLAKPETASRAIPAGMLLQRKCACGGSGDCKDCDEKQEGTLPRSARDASAHKEMPPIVHEMLRSPGQPLDPATRAFFEPRFGRDFSDVRVYTDEPATRSATSVNARAYTIGRDVVFGVGQYAPTNI
jgi:hypothetical protein